MRQKIEALFQEIFATIQSELLQTIADRGRHFWSRSPLNVASHKLRVDVVAMMVRDAGIDVNSIDEVKDCQRF